jgi:hypothetical protein
MATIINPQMNSRAHHPRGMMALSLLFPAFSEDVKPT